MTLHCIPRSRLVPPVPIALGELLSILAGVEPMASQATFPVDVSSSPEAHVLHVDVPGVPRDQISLDVRERQLTLTLARAEQGQRPHVHGCRTFDLPKDVTREDIHASLKDGVLTLTLPRIQPAPAFTRQIGIEEGAPPDSATAEDIPVTA